MAMNLKLLHTFQQVIKGLYSFVWCFFRWWKLCSSMTNHSPQRSFSRTSIYIYNISICRSLYLASFACSFRDILQSLGACNINQQPCFWFKVLDVRPCSVYLSISVYWGVMYDGSMTPCCDVFRLVLLPIFVGSYIVMLANLSTQVLTKPIIHHNLFTLCWYWDPDTIWSTVSPISLQMRYLGSVPSLIILALYTLVVGIWSCAAIINPSVSSC